MSLRSSRTEALSWATQEGNGHPVQARSHGDSARRKCDGRQVGVRQEDHQSHDETG